MVGLIVAGHGRSPESAGQYLVQVKLYSMGSVPCDLCGESSKSFRVCIGPVNRCGACEETRECGTIPCPGIATLIYKFQ